jgi:hypothetical protein
MQSHKGNFIVVVSEKMDGPVVAATLVGGMLIVAIRRDELSGPVLVGIVLVGIMAWTMLKGDDAPLAAPPRSEEVGPVVSAPTASSVASQHAFLTPTPAATAPFRFENAAARVHAFPVRDAELQARRDEFVFRREIDHPTSASRAKVLESMYEELTAETAKRDPALRPVGPAAAGTQQACNFKKGLSVPPSI